ncbi:hypothetical protein [Elizabethkingia meningoseptica]|uniref:hypothetical protein n=1 Tax=Elizabethkingia meningoseptica TaxID=238 RepID=UPI0023B05E3F|nr:hypothetical protein [Elizabethkingia meningoseptica]MDE5432709.1 hypothetical protein [Elizabethkingia meningoseptica]
MKRTILRASLWGVLTLSLFYSCRTDSATTEQTIASKEKIAAFERFEKENNIIKPIASNNQSVSPSKYVSYAYPFAQVIYNFLQNHPDYAKKVENEAGTIRLDVVSQTFGDAKKAVIFPVTNNEGKVIAAWAGVVNENRDYVDFYYLNGNSDNVTTIKTAFQNYYDQKKTKQLASIAVASTKGINPIALAPTPPPVVPVVDINEVHITVPPPDLTISSSAAFGAGSINYGNTLGGGMSGSSTTHGGGSGTGTPNANQEIINNLEKYPCAQKLLEQLPNLNNSLAKILNDALATNSKIKVTFVGGPLKGDKPGELLAGRTSYVSTNNETGVVSYNIILNQDVLKSATQEYTLALMYHESIHAFLLNQHTVLGADEFFRKYPYLENYVVGGVTKFKFIPGNHQAYGPFVNMIADAIQSYNPKFPRDRAISLAMEGITEEDLPNNGDSYNTIERYSGDTAVGTKCAKP